MTEPTNEAARRATKTIGAPVNGLNDKDIAAAQVWATLAVAEELAALREVLVDQLGPTGAIAEFLDEIAPRVTEVLVDQLGPTGAIAGFLDEIAVRVAPDGDSVAEAIVSVRTRDGDL